MARRAAALAIATALGLGLGVLGGAALRERSGDATPAAGPSGAAGAWQPKLAELRDALAAERDARRSLEAEVALLRAAIAGDGAGETEAEAVGGADEPGDDAASGAGAALAGGDDAPRWFDAARLREAGVSEAEIARLRERFEAYEMEELRLRDTASREGWLRRPRYAVELQRMRSALREELGEDEYDRMLYATGRNNRAIVSDVLGNSPAASSGLRAGDAVLSYAGQRIFDMRELSRATTRCAAGTTVELRVQRGAEDLRVYAPCGPLGVRLRADRRAPDRL